MSPEKWSEIVSRITDEFTVQAHETERLDPGPGTCEYIEFIGPAGKMKIERVVTPKVVGHHGVGSRRIGSSSGVAVEYSADEQIDRISAYRWDERITDWVELGGSAPFV
ncbi:MAG: hypothetical protein WC289_02810 [Patescibacteria group bacterium]|jgi:hypothetical protein